MDSAEILSLLEKPTRDGRRFVYQIRDEAAVADIMAALRESTNSQTRSLLCYMLNLRADTEFFEGRSSETKQAVPALIEALADPDEDVRGEAIDALGHIGDPAAGPALLALYHEEEDPDKRLWLASDMAACQYAPVIPILIEALSSAEDPLPQPGDRSLRNPQAAHAKGPLRQG